MLADAKNESAAFALVGVAEHTSGIDILVRRPVAVPARTYEERGAFHLRVGSVAINGLAALCDANGLGALICHSHPTEVDYSPTDDYGERRVVEALRPFLPRRAPTASLLFSPEQVRGRVWQPDQRNPEPLDEIVILGRALRRIRIRLTEAEEPIDPIYDRQVLAFGEDGQRMIQALKVGLIGIGGTGSAEAEQLVRLGVRDLVLIDPDEYEESNRTRVYGTFETSSEVGDSKAEIIAAHLRAIDHGVSVQVVALNVAVDEAAQQLRDRDVMLLCTDDHWGRSVVNQLAYQYLIPTINVGTRITSSDGQIEAAVGVVDVLRPDLPCLWCKQTLSSARIAAESMPDSDRAALVGEGYVQGIETDEPSVVSITTGLAGLAITGFLQLATDFMGETGSISRLNWDITTGTVRRGTGALADDCVCFKVRGFGDLHGRGTMIESN